jgi:hypothetical protein
MKPLTPERIAEIEKRCNAATAGPWTNHASTAMTVRSEAACPHPVVCSAAYVKDSTFIAHARTDIPDLLNEIKRLREGRLKDDQRKGLGMWAPGGYFCKCSKCGCNYGGDKRSTMCADCAYQQSALTELEHISLNLCGTKVEGDVTHDMVYHFVEGAIEQQADLRAKAENELAALKAELASLQAEIVKVNSYRETLRLRHHQVTDERDQLNAENEALRKDKNRLDWLEQSPHVRVEIRQLSQFDDYQTIRAAIDAAKGGQ